MLEEDSNLFIYEYIHKILLYEVIYIYICILYKVIYNIFTILSPSFFAVVAPLFFFSAAKCKY